MVDKNDEPIEFDELNLDDLDFDPFDQEMGDPFGDMKDDRTPEEHFKESAKKTVVERMLDPGLIRRFLGLALPKGYTQALNAYDGLTESVGDVYKEHSTELAPQLRKFKTRLDRSNPILKRMLPKGLLEALDEADRTQNNTYEEKDELSTNLEGLDRLFSLEAHSKAQQELREAVAESRDEKQFNLEMAAQLEIGKGIGRLVSYQDNILINYQRKSLELKYRHLDVSSRLLQTSREYYAESIAILKRVGKNSALPDFLKMHGSELIKQQLTQRLTSSAMNSAAGWIGNYFKNIRQNASDFVGSALDANSQLSMGEGMGEGVGLSRAQMTGQIAGSVVGDGISQGAKWVLDDLATRLAPLLEKVPGITRGGNSIRKTLSGLPQRLNEYAQSETTREGILGVVEESIKSVLDRHTASNTIRGGGLEVLDQPAYMDNRFHRTVVDIIPGYLASMDKWIRVLATGEDQEEAAYSHYSGGFVSRSTLNQQNVRIALLDKQGSSVRSQVDGLLRDMNAQDLSLEAKRALRRQLMRDMSSANDFKPERYVKTDTWNKLSEEIAQELVEFFSDTFNLDIEGNPTDTSDAAQTKFNDIRNSYLELQGRLKDYGGRMNALQDAVGRRSWRELGLSRYDGLEGDVIDLDAVYDLIVNSGDDFNPTEKKKEKKSFNREDLSPEEVLKRMREAREKKEKEKRKVTDGVNDPVDILNIAASETNRGGIGPRELKLDGANVVANVELPDTFETTDSETHRRLDSLIEINNAQRAALDLILEAANKAADCTCKERPVGNQSSLPGATETPSESPTSDQPTPETESGQDTRSRWQRFGVGGLGSIAKGVGKGAYNYTKAAYKLTWAMTKGTANAAWAASKLPFQSIKGLGVSDVYIQGNPEPVLLARDIRRGIYFDVNSRKVIESLSDITGAVKDRNGETVITQEEFDQGLMSGDGESLAGFLGRKSVGVAGTLAKWTWAYTSGTYGLMGKAIKGAFNLAYDQFTQFDAYFPGEDEPRIRSNLLKKGYYRDKDGAPISSLEDIKGPVFDIHGNEVVSQDDLDRYKSFYTRNGSLLFTVGRGFVSIAKWGTDLAWKGAKAYAGAVGKFYKGLWDVTKSIAKLPRNIYRAFRGDSINEGSGSAKVDDELARASHDVNVEQLKTQRDILSELRRQFKQDDTHTFDQDGDGDIDNSWEDITSRRTQVAQERKRLIGPAGAAGTQSVVEALDSLGDKLDKNFDSLEEVVEESNEDGLLDQAADLAEIAGSGGGDSDRGRRGRGGKKGLLRRGVGTLGRGIKAAGRGLWSLGGMAVSGIAAAAPAVGSAITGLGSMLSAPVVLGAAAVAGTAYLGYKGYKWYKGRDAAKHPLFSLRMKQYGVDPTDEERVERILKLERLVRPAIRIEKDNAISLEATSINVEELFHIFGVDPQDKKRVDPLLKWTANRFRRVYLAHVGSVKRHTGETDLSRADEKVTPDEFNAFLADVEMRGMLPVYNNTEDSPFDDELTETATDVAETVEHIRQLAKEKSVRKDTDLEINPLTSQVIDKTKDKTKLSVSPTGTNRVDDITKDLARNIEKTGMEDLSHKGVSAAAKGLKSLDIPTAVRYKTYGLKELTLDKCQQLYKIEELYWPAIGYSGISAADIVGDTATIEAKVMSVFLPKDDKEIDQIRKWLKLRFIPTFLQYAISCRRRYNGDAKSASRNLTGPQMYEVLDEVSRTIVKTDQGEVSVWNVTASPWPGYELETQAGSVKLYMDALPKEDRGGPLTVDGLKAVDNSSAQNAEFKDRMMNIARGNTHTPLGQVRSNASTLQNMTSIFRGGSVAGGSGGQSTTGNGDGSLLMTGQSTGQAVKHPGGGTSGDINTLPDSKGNGWENNKDLIVAAAKMTGFDPAVAATTAAIESTFRPRAGAGTSSAKGLFQFINGTWAAMLKKYGQQYGIAPNTHQFDAKANTILGMKYLTENYNYLKKRIKGEVTDTSLYAAHFMGPGGAAKLLTANPNAPATAAADGGQINANPDIFKANGRIRTVGEVIGELDRRVKRARGMHDLSGNASVALTTPSNTQESKDQPASPSATPPTENAVENNVNQQMVANNMDAAVGVPTANKDISSLDSGALKAASAANGAASGTSSIAGLMPASIAQEITRPAEEIATQAQSASPTRVIAKEQQATSAAQQAQLAETIGPVLQKQLEVQMSMDGSLREIKGLLAKLNTTEPKIQQPRLEPEIPTPRAGQQTASRNPVNTKRNNAIT